MNIHYIYIYIYNNTVNGIKHFEKHFYINKLDCSIYTFSIPISVADNRLFILINCQISPTGVLPSFFSLARFSISVLSGNWSRTLSRFSIFEIFFSSSRVSSPLVAPVKSLTDKGRLSL